MNKEKDKISVFSFVESVFSNVIYYLILIPLIIITLMIVYQDITEPEKIPNVFGWKLFMILDDRMCDDINYGDLVFTKNIDAEMLKIGDVIAFRNEDNTVTIHEIIEVNNKTQINNKTNEEEQIKVFTMKTRENEVANTKYVQDSNVEGILRKRIPIVGLIILYIQKPLVLLTIICIILIIGLICLYIAQQLDKRDEKRLKEKEQIQKIAIENQNTIEGIKERPKEKPKEELKK